MPDKISLESFLEQHPESKERLEQHPQKEPHLTALLQIYGNKVGMDQANFNWFLKLRHEDLTKVTADQFSRWLDLWLGQEASRSFAKEYATKIFFTFPEYLNNIFGILKKYRLDSLVSQVMVRMRADYLMQEDNNLERWKNISEILEMIDTPEYSASYFAQVILFSLDADLEYLAKDWSLRESCLIFKKKGLLEPRRLKEIINWLSEGDAQNKTKALQIVSDFPENFIGLFNALRKNPVPLDFAQALKQLEKFRGKSEYLYMRESVEKHKNPLALANVLTVSDNPPETKETLELLSVENPEKYKAAKTFLNGISGIPESEKNEFLRDIRWVGDPDVYIRVLTTLCKTFWWRKNSPFFQIKSLRIEKEKKGFSNAQYVKNKNILLSHFRHGVRSIEDKNLDIPTAFDILNERSLLTEANFRSLFAQENLLKCAQAIKILQDGSILDQSSFNVVINQSGDKTARASALKRLKELGYWDSESRLKVINSKDPMLELAIINLSKKNLGYSYDEVKELAQKILNQQSNTSDQAIEALELIEQYINREGTESKQEIENYVRKQNTLEILKIKMRGDFALPTLSEGIKNKQEQILSDSDPLSLLGFLEKLSELKLDSSENIASLIESNNRKGTLYFLKFKSTLNEHDQKMIEDIASGHQWTNTYWTKAHSVMGYYVALLSPRLVPMILGAKNPLAMFEAINILYSRFPKLPIIHLNDFRQFENAQKELGTPELRMAALNAYKFVEQLQSADARTAQIVYLQLFVKNTHDYLKRLSFPIKKLQELFDHCFSVADQVERSFIPLDKVLYTQFEGKSIATDFLNENGYVVNKRNQEANLIGVDLNKLKRLATLGVLEQRVVDFILNGVNSSAMNDRLEGVILLAEAKLWKELKDRVLVNGIETSKFISVAKNLSALKGLNPQLSHNDIEIAAVLNHSYPNELIAATFILETQGLKSYFSAIKNMEHPLGAAQILALLKRDYFKFLLDKKDIKAIEQWINDYASEIPWNGKFGRDILHDNGFQYNNIVEENYIFSALELLQGRIERNDFKKIFFSLVENKNFFDALESFKILHSKELLTKDNIYSYVNKVTDFAQPLKLLLQGGSLDQSSFDYLIKKKNYSPNQPINDIAKEINLLKQQGISFALTDREIENRLYFSYSFLDQLKSNNLLNSENIKNLEHFASSHIEDMKEFKSAINILHENKILSQEELNILLKIKSSEQLGVIVESFAFLKKLKLWNESNKTILLNNEKYLESINYFLSKISECDEDKFRKIIEKKSLLMEMYKDQDKLDIYPPSTWQDATDNPGILTDILGCNSYKEVVSKMREREYKAQRDELLAQAQLQSVHSVRDNPLSSAFTRLEQLALRMSPRINDRDEQLKVLKEISEAVRDMSTDDDIIRRLEDIPYPSTQNRADIIVLMQRMLKTLEISGGVNRDMIEEIATARKTLVRTWRLGTENTENKRKPSLNDFKKEIFWLLYENALTYAMSDDAKEGLSEEKLYEPMLLGGYRLKNVASCHRGLSDRLLQFLQIAYEDPVFEGITTASYELMKHKLVPSWKKWRRVYLQEEHPDTFAGTQEEPDALSQSAKNAIREKVRQEITDEFQKLFLKRDTHGQAVFRADGTPVYEIAGVRFETHRDGLIQQWLSDDAVNYIPLDEDEKEFVPPSASVCLPSTSRSKRDLGGSCVEQLDKEIKDLQSLNLDSELNPNNPKDLALAKFFDLVKIQSLPAQDQVKLIRDKMLSEPHLLTQTQRVDLKEFNKYFTQQCENISFKTWSELEKEMSAPRTIIVCKTTGGKTAFIVRKHTEGKTIFEWHDRILSKNPKLFDTKERLQETLSSVYRSNELTFGELSNLDGINQRINRLVDGYQPGISTRAENPTAFGLTWLEWRNYFSINGETISADRIHNQDELIQFLLDDNLRLHPSAIVQSLLKEGADAEGNIQKLQEFLKSRRISVDKTPSRFIKNPEEFTFDFLRMEPSEINTVSVSKLALAHHFPHLDQGFVREALKVLPTEHTLWLMNWMPSLMQTDEKTVPTLLGTEFYFRAVQPWLETEFFPRIESYLEGEAAVARLGETGVQGAKIGLGALKTAVLHGPTAVLAGLPIAADFVEAFNAPVGSLEAGATFGKGVIDLLNAAAMFLPPGVSQAVQVVLTLVNSAISGHLVIHEQAVKAGIAIDDSLDDDLKASIGYLSRYIQEQLDKANMQKAIIDVAAHIAESFVSAPSRLKVTAFHIPNAQPEWRAVSSERAAEMGEYLPPGAIMPCEGAVEMALQDLDPSVRALISAENPTDCVLQAPISPEDITISIPEEVSIQDFSSIKTVAPNFPANLLSKKFTYIAAPQASEGERQPDYAVVPTRRWINTEGNVAVFAEQKDVNSINSPENIYSSIKLPPTEVTVILSKTIKDVNLNGRVNDTYTAVLGADPYASPYSYPISVTAENHIPTIRPRGVSKFNVVILSASSPRHLNTEHLKQFTLDLQSLSPRDSGALYDISLDTEGLKIDGQLVLTFTDISAVEEFIFIGAPNANHRLKLPKGTTALVLKHIPSHPVQEGAHEVTKIPQNEISADTMVPKLKQIELGAGSKTHLNITLNEKQTAELTNQNDKDDIGIQFLEETVTVNYQNPHHLNWNRESGELRLEDSVDNHVESLTNHTLTADFKGFLNGVAYVQEPSSNATFIESTGVIGHQSLLIKTVSSEQLKEAKKILQNLSENSASSRLFRADTTILNSEKAILISFNNNQKSSSFNVGEVKNVNNKRKLDVYNQDKNQTIIIPALNIFEKMNFHDSREKIIINTPKDPKAGLRQAEIKNIVQTKNHLILQFTTYKLKDKSDFSLNENPFEEKTLSMKVSVKDQKLPMLCMEGINYLLASSQDNKIEMVAQLSSPAANSSSLVIPLSKIPKLCNKIEISVKASDFVIANSEIRVDKLTFQNDLMRNQEDNRRDIPLVLKFTDSGKTIETTTQKLRNVYKVRSIQLSEKQYLANTTPSPTVASARHRRDDHRVLHPRHHHHLRHHAHLHHHPVDAGPMTAGASSVHQSNMLNILPSSTVLGDVWKFTSTIVHKTIDSIRQQFVNDPNRQATIINSTNSTATVDCKQGNDSVSSKPQFKAASYPIKQYAAPTASDKPPKEIIFNNEDCAQTIYETNEQEPRAVVGCLQEIDGSLTSLIANTGTNDVKFVARVGNQTMERVEEWSDPLHDARLEQASVDKFIERFIPTSGRTPHEQEIVDGIQVWKANRAKSALSETVFASVLTHLIQATIYKDIPLIKDILSYCGFEISYEEIGHLTAHGFSLATSSPSYDATLVNTASHFFNILVRSKYIQYPFAQALKKLGFSEAQKMVPWILESSVAFSVAAAAALLTPEHLDMPLFYLVCTLGQPLLNHPAWSYLARPLIEGQIRANQFGSTYARLIPYVAPAVSKLTACLFQGEAKLQEMLSYFFKTDRSQEIEKILLQYDIIAYKISGVTKFDEVRDKYNSLIKSGGWFDRVEARYPKLEDQIKFLQQWRDKEWEDFWQEKCDRNPDAIHRWLKKELPQCAVLASTEESAEVKRIYQSFENELECVFQRGQMKEPHNTYIVFYKLLLAHKNLFSKFQAADFQEQTCDQNPKGSENESPGNGSQTHMLIRSKALLTVDSMFGFFSQNFRGGCTQGCYGPSVVNSRRR